MPLSELNSLDVGGDPQSLKERNNKRVYVQDLLNVMEQLDESADPDGVGLVQDFSKGKSFVHFDPYGEDSMMESYYSALKYEDSTKLRASIVLEAYSKQVEGIEQDGLSFEDKERYERVIALLDYMRNIKIIDAPVLLKIYNLHRCSL